MNTEKLNDKILRNYYESLIGRPIRKYQWENLKEDLILAFPDAGEVTKEQLLLASEYKKIAPNWKVESLSIYAYKQAEANIPNNGLCGAELFLRCQQIVNYPASDNSIRKWFYDAVGKSSLSAHYTKDACKKILMKAVTSKPRAFTKG